MPLDRAITNLRQLHGFGMKSEVELRRVVLAVLEGVQSDKRVGYVGSVAFFEGPLDDEPSEAASMAFTAMIDHLIREASGEEAREG